MQLPSLQELLESGVHFGHQVNRWHPQMEQYIYGSRDNIHIIDLLKTRKQLEEAAAFLKEQAKEGKVILFLGTKHQAQAIVKEEAERAGMPFLDKRWIGGLITNWEQMKRNLDKLNRYDEEKTSKKFSVYTKKEKLLMERKMQKQNLELSGVKAMGKLPDILFIVDPKKETNAVLEATKRGIPVVALCDTNTNPQLINYPIPGNDDSIKSVRIIVKTIADAIIEGKAGIGKEASKDTKANGVQAEQAEEPVIVNEEAVIEELVDEVEGAVQEQLAEEGQAEASNIEKAMGSVAKASSPKEEKESSGKASPRKSSAGQAKSKAEKGKSEMKAAEKKTTAKAAAKPKAAKKPATKATTKKGK